MNPGTPEHEMVVDFSADYQDMWVHGSCTSPDCSGDPIAVTPLTCADPSIQAQFVDWTGQYDGPADELRECIVLVKDIMGKIG